MTESKPFNEKHIEPTEAHEPDDEKAHDRTAGATNDQPLDVNPPPGVMPSDHDVQAERQPMDDVD